MSTVGELGKSLSRAYTGTKELFYRSGRVLNPMERAYDPTGIMSRNIEEAQREQQANAPSPGVEKSWPLKWATETIESMGPSLAAGLPVYLASLALGGPIGGLAAFAIGAGGSFFLSQYDRIMQKGKEQGIPESKMRPYAIAEGLIEGGVEGATDYLGGKWLGLDKTLVSNPLKNTIKQMLAPTIRGQVVRFAKTAPLEIGTEMLQNSSEEWLSQRAGLAPESTPWEAAKQSIGPALGMTILYNIGGMGFHKIHQAQLQRALFTDNVSEKYRSRAISEVESGILDYAKTYEKSDPVAAEQYRGSGVQMGTDGGGV